MNPYNFILLFYAFCSFFLGFFVWVKRSDRVSKLFFVFNIFNSLWSTLFAISISDNLSYKEGLFCARLLNVAALFIAPIWFHFVVAFCKRQDLQKRIILFYSLSFLILVSVPTSLFVSDVRSISVFKHYAVPGLIFHLFTIHFSIVITLSFITLYRRLLEVRGEEREVVKGLLFAAGVAFFGGALAFLGVYGIPLPPYNLLVMPVYPFLMAYFMMRKNLFGLEEFAELAHKEKLATISTLASSVNHEIKNPLYVIRSQAEAFIEKSENIKDKAEAFDGSIQVMKKALEQSNRAMAIMKRFSSFAKQGSATQENEQVKVREVVEYVLQLVSYELESIEVENNISKDCVVSFSKHDLEQVLFNLIRNACQAAGDDGKVIISVKTNVISTKSLLVGKQRRMERSLDSARDDRLVQLTITDTGPGMTKEQIKQIFKPFYSTKEEGSGVGLYVTKKLVERNGGKIHVHSTIGKGTTFVLELKNESV